MTQILKLARGFDGTADQDTLDLLSYTEGFNVAYEGWTPKTPYGDETEVIETITLRVKGSSHDDLASKLQDIAQYSKYAKWYRDNPSEKYGVWLRAKLDGETGTRQAWVHELNHGMAASIYSRAVNEKYTVNSYVVQARRMPYWEGTAATTLVEAGLPSSQVFTIGGTVGYAAVPGDTHARIEYMLASCESTTTMIRAARRVWAGFMTDKNGPVTDFTPAYSLAAAYTDLSDTSPAGSPNVYAFGGTELYHTFAGTPEWFRIKTPTRYGKYLVLLRGRASATSPNIRARMFVHYTGAYNEGIAIGKYFPWVPIAWDDAAGLTGSKYFEMGVINIPMSGRSIDGVLFDSSNISFGHYITFYVHRASGSEWAAFDAVVFMPVEEGYLRTNTANVRSTMTSLETRIELSQHPDGAITAADEVQEIWGVSAWQPIYHPDVYIDRGVPPSANAGMMVFALDDMDGMAADEYATVTLKIIPRWKELRGSE